MIVDAEHGASAFGNAVTFADLIPGGRRSYPTNRPKMLQPRCAPVDFMTGQESEIIPQIERVRPDRARRPLDRGEVGQELVHRLDNRELRIDHRPGLPAASR
nr:hypothetical protein [Nocardia suismassiliense]